MAIKKVKRLASDAADVCADNLDAITVAGGDCGETVEIAGCAWTSMLVRTACALDYSHLNSSLRHKSTPLLAVGDSGAVLAVLQLGTGLDRGYLHW